MVLEMAHAYYLAGILNAQNRNRMNERIGLLDAIKRFLAKIDIPKHGGKNIKGMIGNVSSTYFKNKLGYQVFPRKFGR